MSEFHGRHLPQVVRLSAMGTNKNNIIMLLNIIRKAIAFITGQTAVVEALKARIQELESILQRFRNQSELDTSTLRRLAADAHAEAVASDAKAAELAATLANLEQAGSELAATINAAPETPVVDSGFNVVAEEGAFDSAFSPAEGEAESPPAAPVAPVAPAAPVAEPESEAPATDPAAEVLPTEGTRAE